MTPSIFYDQFLGPNEENKTMLVYEKELKMKNGKKYSIKGFDRYYYNGNCIGFIDKSVMNEDYSYTIDSMNHQGYLICFFRNNEIIYKASQSNVKYDYLNSRWIAFYTDSVFRDDFTYKTKNVLYFKKP